MPRYQELKESEKLVCVTAHEFDALLKAITLLVSSKIDDLLGENTTVPLTPEFCFSVVRVVLELSQEAGVQVGMEMDTTARLRQLLTRFSGVSGDES